MALSVAVSFVAIFAAVLLAAAAGLKLIESRRKTQVANMLHAKERDVTISVATLLKDLGPERPTGLRQLLTSLQFSRHIAEQIQQAGLDWPATRLISVMGLAAMGGFGLGVLMPFLFRARLASALAAGVALGCMPYLIVRHKRSRRLSQLEEQFPEALDFLARSMRAGHAFPVSLEMVGGEIEAPLGLELRSLFNEQNLGAPLDVALRNFTTRVPLLDARFFTSSVLLQKQTGGNLSEVLSRLAYVIRERFRLKGQVKAASAHGRLTAAILSLLPVFTTLAMLAVAPGYLEEMAGDPDGRRLISAAVAAQIVGNFLIKRIINIKV